MRRSRREMTLQIVGKQSSAGTCVVVGPYWYSDIGNLNIRTFLSRIVFHCQKYIAVSDRFFSFFLGVPRTDSQHWHKKIRHDRCRATHATRSSNPRSSDLQWPTFSKCPSDPQPAAVSSPFVCCLAITLMDTHNGRQTCSPVLYVGLAGR